MKNWEVGKEAAEAVTIPTEIRANGDTFFATTITTAVSWTALSVEENVTAPWGDFLPVHEGGGSRH